MAEKRDPRTMADVYRVKIVPGAPGTPEWYRAKQLESAHSGKGAGIGRVGKTAKSRAKNARTAMNRIKRAQEQKSKNKGK